MPAWEPFRPFRGLCFSSPENVSYWNWRLPRTIFLSKKKDRQRKDRRNSFGGSPLVRRLFVIANNAHHLHLQKETYLRRRLGSVFCWNMNWKSLGGNLLNMGCDISIAFNGNPSGTGRKLCVQKFGEMLKLPSIGQSEEQPKGPWSRANEHDCLRFV